MLVKLIFIFYSPSPSLPSCYHHYERHIDVDFPPHLTSQKRASREEENCWKCFANTTKCFDMHGWEKKLHSELQIARENKLKRNFFLSAGKAAIITLTLMKELFQPASCGRQQNSATQIEILPLAVILRPNSSLYSITLGF